MFHQRLLSAAVLLPLFLLVAIAGDPLFSLATAAIAVLAYSEFHRMMVQGGHSPLRLAGLAFTLLFIFNAYLVAHAMGDNTAPVVAGAVVVPLVLLMARPIQKGAAEAWSLTLGGSLYIGWLLSFFILMRNLPAGSAPGFSLGFGASLQGLSWVLIAVLSTFACDSAAYLVGRNWGRHKMVPHLSPGKTWEGAAGGLAAAIIAAALLTAVFNRNAPALSVPLGVLQAALLGALVGAVAPLGDLAESLIKRSVQAKDAGGLIPGHGGILDRLDSLLFTGAAVYFVSRLFVL